MKTYAALLRGINVGGHKKLPMAELRTVAASLGCASPRTYIQSGNLVCEWDGPAERLEQRLTAGIAAHFGFTVPTMVRSADELARIAAAHPWPDRELDPAKLTVAFLSAPVPPGVALPVPDGLSEEAVVSGREVYVYYPDGQGRSKLEQRGFWKPLAGIDVTVRNWRTLQKLIDLAG